MCVISEEPVVDPDSASKRSVGKEDPIARFSGYSNDLAPILRDFENVKQRPPPSITTRLVKQTISRNKAMYLTEDVLNHYLKKKFPSVKDFKLGNHHYLWTFAVPELVDENEIDDWMEKIHEKG